MAGEAGAVSPLLCDAARLDGPSSTFTTVSGSSAMQVSEVGTKDGLIQPE